MRNHPWLMSFAKPQDPASGETSISCSCSRCMLRLSSRHPWPVHGLQMACFKSCNQEIWKCPALQSQVQALSEVQCNSMALHFPPFLSRHHVKETPRPHKSDSFLRQTEKNTFVKAPTENGVHGSDVDGRGDTVLRKRRAMMLRTNCEHSFNQTDHALLEAVREAFSCLSRARPRPNARFYAYRRQSTFRIGNDSIRMDFINPA